MPRNISFAETKPQFKARTKDVTRREGWERVKPGDILCGVEKCQGIPKGGRVTKLGLIRVKSVRREPLKRMTDDPVYGAEECRREGFPDMTPAEFVAFYCKVNGNRPPANPVTRIEYEYIDTLAKQEAA